MGDIAFGLSVYDLPDIDFRSLYEAGKTAQTAVEEAWQQIVQTGLAEERLGSAPAQSIRSRPAACYPSIIHPPGAAPVVPGANAPNGATALCIPT